MLSTVQRRGQVSFPLFTGERVYMQPFTKKAGLPVNLARWQPTVDAMLDGVETDQQIYLMIDQKEVGAGHSQRRPGMHVDGYWIPAIHGHDGGGHGWHRHIRHGSCPNNAWSHVDFNQPEAIILASDVSASRALVGEFDGVIGEGGDCSHLNLSHLPSVTLQSGHVWAGNVSMLHESLPVERTCRRTLVRLNVPNWTPLQ